MRFWTGGFGKDQDCCFDFIEGGVVKNIPSEWRISRLGNSPVVMMSMGKAWGLVNIAPGDEKFLTSQGSVHRIDIRGGRQHSVGFETPLFVDQAAKVIPGRAATQGHAVTF